MNHAAPQPHTDPIARAVNRAMGDIRRGVPVFITHHSTRLIALPAETATEATLQECLAAADRDASLHLLLSTAADQPPDAPNRIAAVPLGRDQLTAQSLRTQADPTCAGAHPYLSRGPISTHTLHQAAIELVKLARLLPAMLVAPAATDTAAAGLPNGLPTDLLTVWATDILAYPAETARTLAPAAHARVPLDAAENVRIVAFRPPDGGIEHLAILIGTPEQTPPDADPPLVRVHSECFTGDLLGSRRCDCGPQLHQAIARMEAEGAGVILYMAQEGRGIGLVNKLRAYTLQDGIDGQPGLDTLDANRALGYGADERSFAAAAAMLHHLGVTRIRLLTNNPAKIAALAAHGIDVTTRVSAAIAANGENDAYLETKARRFGHLLT